MKLKMAINNKYNKEEARIAKKIVYYKQQQRKFRKKWLETDLKISVLKMQVKYTRGKINEKLRNATKEPLHRTKKITDSSKKRWQKDRKREIYRRNVYKLDSFQAIRTG